MDNRRFNIHFTLKGMIDISHKFSMATRAVAEDFNVGFLPLRLSVPNTADYFGDNVHYSNDGARVVATSVYEYIATYLEAHRTPPSEARDSASLPLGTSALSALQN
jgi:hypothetical protein